MIIPSSTHHLKNKRLLTVRPPTKQEAQDLVNLKKSYLAEANTIPILPEEYRNSREDEQELIHKYATRATNLLLVSEVDGRLVGNIDLTGSHWQRMAHTGVIGMGILNKYQGLGIGTILLQRAIEWATLNSPLELIWLDVYANNERGLRLYKKAGFQVSGVIKGFFKQNGQYFDKVQMYRKLAHVTGEET